MDFSECLESMLLFFMSDASLAGRNLKMMNVTAYGHLDAAGEGLEDTFYFVVFIGSLGFDMEVHTGRITQRLEEMEEHLGRHVAQSFSRVKVVSHTSQARPPKSSETIHWQSSMGRQ